MYNNIKVRVRLKQEHYKSYIIQAWLQYFQNRFSTKL